MTDSMADCTDGDSSGSSVTRLCHLRNSRGRGPQISLIDAEGILVRRLEEVPEALAGLARSRTQEDRSTSWLDRPEFREGSISM